MNAQLLIDAIVRQTTALIAQLATSGGIRAPLADVANQVFLDLTREIERQGVSRKVSADMFGMALRTYLKKIQRLTESSTERGRSLWEAVFEFLQARDMVTRREVLEHFVRDDEALVGSVLFDLTESGFAFRSRTGDDTTYRIASSEELGQMRQASEAGSDELVWVMTHREGPLARSDLVQRLRLREGENEGEIDRAIERLSSAGRIQSQQHDGRDVYVATEFFIPLGQSLGWEAAVFDHYQAVVKTICRRLQGEVDAGGIRASGSTYSFDVWTGHPQADEVRTLLDDFRARATDLRGRIDRYNTDQGIPDEYEEVSVYMGQCGVFKSRALNGSK